MAIVIEVRVAELTERKTFEVSFSMCSLLEGEKALQDIQQLDERNVSKFLFSCFLMSFRIEANPFMLD